MIHGRSGVVSCDWTPSPPPQFPTSLLFLLLSFIYYFRKYNGKHRNCLYTGDRPLPPQENVLRRRMGEGSGKCYNCGKSRHLAKYCRVVKITCWKCGGGGRTRNVCPSKYKITTKTDKKEERSIIFIHTDNISNSTMYNLLYFYKYILYLLTFFANYSTFTNLVK